MASRSGSTAVAHNVRDRLPGATKRAHWIALMVRRRAMLLRAGAPVFAGVSFLLFALVVWVRGRRQRSRALRWFSLGQVSFALCAGLAAVAQLADVRTFALRSDLSLAVWLLAVCACLVAGVYGIREMQRGSGLQW